MRLLTQLLLICCFAHGVLSSLAFAIKWLLFHCKHYLAGCYNAVVGNDCEVSHTDCTKSDKSNRLHELYVSVRLQFRIDIC